MLHEKIYQPYACTQFLQDGKTLTAVAPWITLQVELDDDYAQLLSDPKFLRGSDDNDKLQDFYAFFSEYPLLNVRPRPTLARTAPLVASEDTAALSRNPSALVSAMAQRLGLSYANSKLLGHEYSWDPRPVLDSSRLPGTRDLYDPYSIYTAVRELRLAYQFGQIEKSAHVLSYLTRLKERSEEEFFEAITDVMSQQYYVTSKCTDCLNPALNNPHIRDAVAAYIAEEQNHDRLILASIEAVSEKKPHQLFFAPGIMVETELIRYAAEVCPLSFACLVSIMEGSAYPEHDPVGLLLKESSRPHAARGIEAHFQINKSQNHTAIPETFVERLPPVTEEVALSALRMTEVAIKLDADMPRDMYDRFLGRYGKLQ